MIAHSILDEALACIITDASRLDICSGEPRAYADVAKLSLGHKTLPKLSGPVDVAAGASGAAGAGGRAAVIGAIDDGLVTNKGAPKYWCLTGQGKLLVCEPLGNTAPIQVVAGIAFVLPSIHIRILN